VECWVNVPTDVKPGFYYIITNRLRGDEPGWTVCLHRNFHVLVGISDKANSTAPLASKEAINDGKWHHLAITAARKGKLSLFLDGVLQGATDMSEIISPDNDDRPLRIGDRGHDGDFIGMIDEVRISKCVRATFSLDKPY
jgi:hypothetical protein